MYIDPVVVSSVKNEISIVDLINKYVPLRRSGSSEWKGLCPFHDEKTPSLIVYEKTNTFHCFGCNAQNDVIDFYQRIEDVSWTEAVRSLARDYNIPIIGSKQDQSIYRMYQRNEELCLLFQSDLMNTPEALQYLKMRNLSQAVIGSFRLGYAKKNHEEYRLIGNRLVFPVIDDQGRVISFTGRALQEGLKPKYWNGSNNEIFVKGHHFYGIEQAREAIKETKKIIIAEGYVDVLSMHQAGIKNVVAIMGVAFTEKHAEYLKRKYPNVIVYLAFDGDESGRKATIEANKILRKNGIIPLGFPTPYDSDLDVLVQMHGKNLYDMIVETSKEVYGLMIDTLSSRYLYKINEARREFISGLQPIYEELNEYEEDLQLCAEKKWYLSVISESLKINEDELQQHLLKMRK